MENIYKERLFVVAENRNPQVGCGDGSLLNEFTDSLPFLDYTGIDVSERNIGAAKSHFRLDNATFISDDYLIHDFNRQFDLVISYSTLNIIPMPQKVILKISSDIKIGGRVVLGLPYACLRSNLYIFVRSILGKTSWGFANKFIVFVCKGFLSSKYSKEEINQSIVYMTMPPYLIDNETFRNTMKNVGLNLIDEEIETPNTLGKLSHKILTFQKVEPSQQNT